MTAPYRDEKETLRAENERLRAELQKRAGINVGGAVLFLSLDFGMVVLLRPWLNGASDVEFWCALAIIVALGIAAIVSGFGGFRRKRG